MSSTTPVLPTLDKLNATVDPSTNALEISKKWFADFDAAVKRNDVDGLTKLFIPDGVWRDMLALTWDFRTFLGAGAITEFLRARLAETRVSALVLLENTPNKEPLLEHPFPDLAWIRAFFEFTTAVGRCTGIVRLVPTPNSGEWKAWVMYTNLDALKDFPELVGPNRHQEPNHGLWLEQRRKEVEFEGVEPAVLIIGGGQSGLDVAARLKFLNVPTLVIEKQKRVGDQWRNRYQALCLHDPVWYDHMPYIPFPSSWPVWTPAHKLADWLESYAHSLELNVWTSAEPKEASYDEKTKTWTVKVVRGDGTERVFKPRHVVFAVGLAGGVPNIPSIPGMDEFKGKIVHSSAHDSAKHWVGKKAVVLGACTSGHDIAQDFYQHGVDVTLVQRSSTYIMSTKKGMPVLFTPYYCEGGLPTEISDLLIASMPNEVSRLVTPRVVQIIKELDKETLDGLEKVGFKLNDGVQGAGVLYSALVRGGGYYLDVGASQLIADGKIKLKSQAIERFEKDEIVFADGSRLQADIVVLATGYGDARIRIREIFGGSVADKIGQVWGLDEEGELNSVWRSTGHPAFWIMMGNLAWCRFHSTHVALQIKAMEEGIFTTRYSKNGVQDY